MSYMTHTVRARAVGGVVDPTLLKSIMGKKQQLYYMIKKNEIFQLDLSFEKGYDSLDI